MAKGNIVTETVAHTSRTDPRIGTDVAGYRIERLLGRGGMSAVYLATDLALGRKVALKLLSPQLSEDERFQQRFRLESSLAASIDHPNVIPIYEAGQAEDATLFIAMRYVDGADLKRVLQEDGALEIDRVVELLEQAAQGLDEAHARGLVHRDVKPSNVLIARSETGAEHVYLADFGLTKTSTTSEDARESITLSGSSDYVSPEQIRGSGSDQASDIYALGCVAYECLTGEVPFSRPGELEVLFAHMNDEPPPPSAASAHVPAAVDTVIAKAMAKEARERYTSGAELVEAIRRAAVPSARRISRRTAALLAAVLAAIIAAAVVPAVLLTGGGAEKPAAVASVADSGTIETIAGGSQRGFSGDGGPASEARLDEPQGLAFDASGKLYVTEGRNNRIRKIDTDGVITTIAGTGKSGSAAGDGGPATEASLSSPDNPVFDNAGNLYFSDRKANSVRKIDTSGVIATVAGITGNSRGARGAASGRASEARLIEPGIAVAADGTLYVTDSEHHRVLRVDPDGTFVTIAGTGAIGFSGDGGPATDAELNFPWGIGLSPDGSVYVNDIGNFRIRKIDPAGIITTFAGTGTRGYTGDGGPATQARIADGGSDLTFDSDGNLYFADHELAPPTAPSEFGNRIRKIDTNGVITTPAGTGAFGATGDGGPAVEAQLREPRGVAIDADGNLYIADMRNHRIRKVTFDR